MCVILRIVLNNSEPSRLSVHALSNNEYDNNFLLGSYLIIYSYVYKFEQILNRESFFFNYF